MASGLIFFQFSLLSFLILCKLKHVWNNFEIMPQEKSFSVLIVLNLMMFSWHCRNFLSRSWLCLDAELGLVIQTYPCSSLLHSQHFSHFNSYCNSIPCQKNTGGGCYKDLWMIPLEYSYFRVVYVHRKKLTQNLGKQKLFI